MRTLLAAVALSALTVTTTTTAHAQTPSQSAAQRAEEKKMGSRYLRCDGEPNNITDGETFARLLGAVTLLALFAPSPEAPDPSKRLFGEAGVAVCSELIDGDGAETNAVRRVPLILARALHHIEAKNYPAALSDVERARTEATTAKLVGNPYFDRSMGLSFSNIEAEIHLRMGNPVAAQDAAHKAIGSMKYSFLPSIVIRDYGPFLHELAPTAEARLAANAKVLPALLISYASQLDDVGRFADSSAKHEALITVIEGLKLDDTSSIYYARAALAHALAGQWDQANQRAEFARANLATRRTEGKPEDDAARVVEVLDLFDIIKLAQGGDLTSARRNFAARSEWVVPSFGAVQEVNRRLRDGASEAELFGSLAKTPETMWQQRYDDLIAIRLQRDTENKRLFDLIQPYAKVNDFESRSKQTWQVQKSKMMSKEVDKAGQWRIYTTGSLYSGIDAIMLHAALQARAKGKEGFSMFIVLPNEARGTYYPVTVGFARFVNRGEEGVNDDLFISAAEVIAELAPVIPSPDELKLRKQRRG
jgi:tetratricopeptide (TPR) repeat protein